MTQVEQIKAEIERRMLEDYNSSDAQKDEIAQGVCAGILTFINSLQGESMSEDLELASERYACKFSSSKYGHDKIKTAFKAGANWQEEQDNICYEEIFEEGAKWQNEQMMAKAVDGEVGYWNIRGLSVNMELPSKFEEGDKVKLIIVKED